MNQSITTKRRDIFAKKIISIILICISIFTIFGGCSNEKKENNIIGNWESSSGEKLYFNETNMFDSGFAIPYEIKNDTELLITDTTGQERTVKYSIVDETLTIKIGDKGMVYYKAEETTSSN